MSTGPDGLALETLIPEDLDPGDTIVVTHLDHDANITPWTLIAGDHGYQVECKQIEIVQAAHPVPDAVGLRAARRMLAMVSALTARDLVLCLISGGGSALLPLPLPGVTLAAKQAVNRALDQLLGRRVEA